MVFVKEKLCDVPACYAVNAIIRDGALYCVVASDDRGPCHLVDAKTREKHTLWAAEGGTMSIVPLPGRNGEFLISQKFLPVFQSLGAQIMRAYPEENGGWRHTLWLKLPYVHRFDLLHRGNQRYFLGCILSDTDQPAADLSAPGSLVASPIDPDFNPPEALKTIAAGMTRNHGYWKIDKGAYSAALTSCDEGVFYVEPPEYESGAWKIEKILDVPASDIALCDIDGDGEEELAAIEPFHGNHFRVYRKTGQGYEKIYEYPREIAFAHVVWGGELLGEPVFLGGCRRMDQDFFLLRWENGRIAEQMIETGAGPSNIAPFAWQGRQYILSANHGLDEAALYSVGRTDRMA